MTDRKSTRLNSSHLVISYAVFCLKKKKDDKLHLYREIIRERGGREMLGDYGASISPAPRSAGHSPPPPFLSTLLLFFFFNDTATTEIYTLSLHDALPI